MPNTDIDNASKFIDRLREIILKTTIHYDNQAFKISASCGVSQLTQEDSFEMILKAAYKHLYEKKREKDRSKFWFALFERDKLLMKNSNKKPYC